MKFEEILPKLREGYSTRRGSWHSPQKDLLLLENDRLVLIWGGKREEVITLRAILADDWEIAEEPTYSVGDVIVVYDQNAKATLDLMITQDYFGNLQLAIIKGKEVGAIIAGCLRPASCDKIKCSEISLFLSSVSESYEIKGIIRKKAKEQS